MSCRHPSTDALPRSRRIAAQLAATRVAFGALLLRDLAVLRKTLKEFIPRTMLQPFLLVFVFTYVFPKIGQGVGGAAAGEAAFSTMLVAGVVGARDHVPGHPVGRAADGAGVRLHARDRGPRARAAADLAGRDREGRCGRARRACSPRCSCSRSRRSCPATPVHLDINWPVLLTLTPLACYMCGALGLTFGTRFEPRTVPLLFGIVVIPLTFLGAIYYSWASLEPIRWLQILVLVNPLVYMCEGFRAALTPDLVPHMRSWAIYGALIGFTARLHLARRPRVPAARPELSLDARPSRAPVGVVDRRRGPATCRVLDVEATAGPSTGAGSVDRDHRPFDREGAALRAVIRAHPVGRERLVQRDAHVDVRPLGQ